VLVFLSNLVFNNGVHMRLKRAIAEKEFDLRLRDKNIADGKQTKVEIEKQLKQLVDDRATATMTPGREDKNTVN
jgi:hypothetical protein